jgi:predicted dinucleotide-utilizing enzyme
MKVTVEILKDLGFRKDFYNIFDRKQKKYKHVYFYRLYSITVFEKDISRTSLKTLMQKILENASNNAVNNYKEKIRAILL